MARWQKSLWFRRSGSQRARRAARRQELRRLLSESLEQRMLLTTVTGVDPAANAIAATASTDITATFDQSLNAATVTPLSFVAHSSQTGRIVAAAVSSATNTATINPDSDFAAGERIQATVTAAVQNTTGVAATPFVWDFQAAVPFGSAVFSETGSGTAANSVSVALGDLDLDGDLDAFVANTSAGNTVWLNDGGSFSDSGQSLGDHASASTALGDFDGDGDLDAIVTNTNQGNRIWVNTAGVFADSGQSLGAFDSLGVAVGDLDGDGDLDAFVANRLQGNRVWLNDGGVFTDSGQSLGIHSSYGVALGDLDGDGDLDAIVANAYEGNRIWLNTGGVFADSGQSLGTRESLDVSLGDLDGDGDLDAVVANYFQGNRVWLNAGGIFTDSGQDLGSRTSYNAAIGDLDGDGDLDVFVANSYQSNRAWLNDGSGVLTDSGQSLGNHDSSSVALGDLDGDGDLDAYVANFNEPNRVWANQNTTVSIAPDSLIAAEGNSGATAFTFTAERSFNTAGVVTVDFAFAPNGADPAEAADFVGAAFPSGTVTFPDGSASQAVTIEVAGDTDVEMDEGFILTLSNPVGGNAILGAATATGLIRNDDNIDTGDLAAPFRTLLADDGPAHVLVGPTLGQARDSESDGQPSAAADGDDTIGVPDDEDGVQFGTVVFSGQGQAHITVNASAAGQLDAWVDFDGDSSFDAAGEQIFTSQPLAAGDNALLFTVPADARQGQTVARFRLSTAGGLAPTGGAPDGEVEDHTVTISNPTGNGVLTDSGQSLGDHSSNDIQLGDLDGDGDLDAFVANGGDQANRIWLNSGGTLSDSGQALGLASSSAVALGDVDGDGDLDAVVANVGANRVWVNSGGVFSDSGQSLGDHSSYGIALGDLDGDGDLDAIVANNGQGNRVWVNSGGVFTDTGETLGTNNSMDVELGDLDGDGDIDAFVANDEQGNRVWLNNGGTLVDSGQSLGTSNSYQVALADLDGDGDLDAFVANDAQGGRVWINAGGEFSDTGQTLGDHNSSGIALGDVDGDGDVDAFVSNNGQADRIWLNGNGIFSDSGQMIGTLASSAVALGDLDLDGDLDAAVATYAGGNRVLRGAADGSLLSIASVSASKAEGNSGTTEFTFQVSRTGNLSSAGAVSFTVVGSGDNPADAADFGGTFPTGMANFGVQDQDADIVIAVTGDVGLELDEGFSVELSSPSQGGRIVNATATGTIENDDAASVVLNLPAVKDNTLYETNDGSLSNGSGQWLFAGRTGAMASTRIHRGLLAFDVASSIPAGSTITNVTLSLTMDRTNSDNNDVSLHRATSDWGEGASDAFGVEGMGTEPAAGDATWIHTSFNTTTWTTPGGDFVATPSATTIVADIGIYQWTGAGLVADVQSWVDSGSDFGWVLRGEETLTRRAQRFVSRENAVVGDRPSLAVEFIPPTATVSIEATDTVKPEGNDGTTPFTFTVTRAGDTSGETTVNYAVTGSGANPADAADFGDTLPSGTVTFAATETTQTVDINVTGDVTFESDEAFVVTLSNPSPAGTQIGTVTATGTIQNDDAPLPTVTLAVDSPTVAEANGVAVLTATLSAASAQPVTIDLGLSGSATVGDDFMLSSTQISIPAGSTSGTATVTAVQDMVDEPDETVVVDIVSATNAVESGTQQQTVTILDDDEAPGGPPEVVSLEPAANSSNAGVAANVTVTFDQDIDAATASVGTLVLHGMAQGRQDGTVGTVGPTVTFDPQLEFFPGEQVQMTATGGLQSTTGQAAVPHVWQFRASVEDGSGVFADSQQFLSGANSYSVELGDLDRDGDLDAFVANVAEGSNVWFNNGSSFSLSQTLTARNSRDVALGDLDGDGDLDAFVANINQPNRVLTNRSGIFTETTQTLGSYNSRGVALGDLDGDGDLDAFVANYGQGNRIWINDGGVFTDAGQSLGDHASHDVSLGDLDGDGDLDAFVTNSNQGNRIWLNAGGIFTDSGQALGTGNSFAVDLGDLDGDGDLDAVIANYGGANRLWLNESGVFTDSGQELGGAESTDVSLGDLDADGDLDAFVTNAAEGNRVWLNDGAVLQDSNQDLGPSNSFGVALGDLDGDGDLDGFVANNNDGNQVWANLNPTISVVPGTLRVGEGDAGATTVTFIVVRSVDTRGTATVDYAFSPSGADPAELDDFVGGVLPSDTLTFTDGVASLLLTIDVAGDNFAEGDEGFSVTLSNPVGSELGQATSDALIRNDDNVDLGDLPFPFPTTLSDDGPSHFAIGPTLGASRDVESDGQPSALADGDDLGGADDEDGVTFGTLMAGQVGAQVTVNASAAAQLDAWIDFNGDGALDASEQIFAGRDVVAGDNLLSFNVPASAAQGDTAARFRLSTAGGLSPRGSAADGEVEDYIVAIGLPLGSGIFIDSEQPLPVNESLAIALGDLDGDGDLDAFAANDAVGNRVLLNDGGVFTDSGQALGNHASFGVSLGDLDGDGDLDAFVTNLGQANRVWLNNGGVFTDSNQTLGNHVSLESALGDIDGDGDLDAVVANGGQANRVWINDGGVFTDSGQLLGLYATTGLDLGDVDGDGDLDLFVANNQQGNRVWVNDRGNFVDSGQSLGDHATQDVALGDFDGDGDLDALAVNRYQGNRLWINENGLFTDSAQSLGDHDSTSLALGDIDGDGDLDAYVTSYYGANHLWLNNGGILTDSGQDLGSHFSGGVALGDVDGDGDIDAAVANYFQNRIWLNQNPTLSVSPTNLPLPEGNSGTTTFEFTVDRLFDTRGVVSVDYSFVPSGTDPAEPDDFVGGVLPSGTLTFEDGVASLVVAVEVVGDNTTENDEGFTLELSNPVGVNPEIGVGTADGVIRNDDSLDLGDLPAPFPTLLADNGPAHIGVGPMLGASRDSEADGQPTAAADGDDLGGTDDEDGVTFGAIVFTGQQQARVTVDVSEAALLDAWIDFNGDMSLQGADEQIFASHPLTAGHNELSFSVPAGARQGTTFARFRVSTAGGLAPTGGANDGEVEDHILSVTNPFGSGVFNDSGQLLGNHASLAVSLGDLDGDGDLDAFIGNGYQHGNRIWLNDGGVFTDSGQELGNHNSSDVALGDLDGDGDLDAFVANSYNSSNRVWLNTGGVFTDSGQALGNFNSYGVSLGDLDGDGDLDAFVANGIQPNRVWTNDGTGSFTDSAQLLGNHDSNDVVLGDLDGDGDLDAFVVNYYQGNRIWVNDSGQFTDSGQELGDHSSFSVAIGDLDGDGDLDAFVGNTYQGNRVWLNTNGTFATNGQSLGNHFSFGVALGDLDGDGDLDAFSGNGLADRIWMNTGGTFTNSGQALGTHSTFAVALGDLDGDGDLDGITASYYPAQPNRIWLDMAGDSLLSVASVNANQAEGDAGVTSFTFEVTRSGNLGAAVDVNFEVTGFGASPADAADFGGTLPSGVVNFAATETVKTITVDVTGDAIAESDEDFVVTLTSSPSIDTQIVTAASIGTIQNDDDAGAGLTVTSLTSTSTGFIAQFSTDLDTALLNIYGTETGNQGPADIILTGASSGPIRGSAVVGDRSITFIRTGGPLDADTYTVTLRSAADGFATLGGLLLDGNGDGTAGDDHVANFVVAAPEANAVTLSLPDFVRGPGQDVDIPADEIGLPLSISSSAAVRNVSLSVDYDPALLDITAAAPGPNMPAGSAVTIDTSTAGRAVIEFTSPADIPAGTNTLVMLTAAIPTANANEIYLTKQVVDIHTATASDAAANNLPVVDDDAYHVVQFFADVSGNGRVNAADASRVARVAALLDTGLASTVLADPVVVGDITGNGRLNAADASRVAQVAALVPVDEIPPIPPGVVTFPITGGPDPKLSIARDINAAVNDTITVPVEIDSIVNLQQPNRLAGVGLVVEYDTNVLTATGVTNGGFITSNPGWSVVPNTSVPGRIIVVAFTSTPVAGQFIDTLVNLEFTVNANAPAGESVINLVAGAGGAFTELLDEDDNFLVLEPAPTNDPTDSVDGLVTIAGAAGPTVSLAVDNGAIVEAGGVATVTATLSAAATADVTVDLGLTGTATNPDDYTASATQITIAVGATSGSVTITAVDDAADEDDETVIVDITGVTGAAEDGDQQVTTTITDDDDPVVPTVTLTVDNADIAEAGGVATFTATLSAAATADVTVDLGFAGAATNPDDYTASATQITIATGATSGTVTVTAVDDAADEANETVIVDIVAANGATEDGDQQATTTITDDDDPVVPTVTLTVDNADIAEAGGVATFTATLSAAATADVTVDLGFAGTATNPNDYTASATQIVVTAGSTSGSVTVTAVDDALDEDDETVILGITNVVGGTEDGDQQATTTILDDDTNLPTVTLTVDSESIAEDGGTTTITATLSAATTSDVIVALGFAGTATSPDDYTASATQIVIAAGGTSGTASVTAVNDLIDEVNESIVVGITAVTGASEDGEQEVTTTITDDDDPVVNNPPVLTDPGTQTMATTQDTLDVVLNATDPDAGAVLTYSATLESAEYLLDSTIGLNFTGDLFENFGGLGEKWLLADDGTTWYYITPEGTFYKWLGGGVLNRNEVAQLSVATFDDPALLYNATAGATVPAAVTVTGNTLTIDPNDGFVGSFAVNVTVSDGSLTDSQLVQVNVQPNEAPVLENPGNQTLPTTQDTLDVALTATDPMGDTLTLTATVESGEYYLDQTIGLQLGPNGDERNWSGSVDEKWVLNDAGDTWYFITPDGSFYRWLGGNRDILANAELVATLSPATHADLTLLYDAQAGVTVPATVGVAGTTLTIDPNAGFTGIFSVAITATDSGGLTDTQLIRVDVTAAPLAAGSVVLLAEGEGNNDEAAQQQVSQVALGFVAEAPINAETQNENGQYQETVDAALEDGDLLDSLIDDLTSDLF